LDLFVQHSHHHALRVHRAEHFSAALEHRFSMDVLHQSVPAVPQARTTAKSMILTTVKPLPPLGWPLLPRPDQQGQIDFPNLASSAYAQTYVVGKPLKLARGYHYLGLDQANGVPQFEDQNKDNLYNSTNDYINIGSLSPEFYGGLGNTITWKGFTLDVFLQFGT
jgi:hypothetical protein